MGRTHGAYSTTACAPGLQQVWQSMRIMRGGFTTADLLVTASAGESAVHKYCRALARAGFLRLARPRRSGHAGSRDVWVLVRDSGPVAPIRRWDGSGVYDPNTDQAWDLQGRLILVEADAAAEGDDCDVDGLAIYADQPGGAA